jgi:hypothetical protein
MTKLEKTFEKALKQYGTEIATKLKVAQDAVGNPAAHAEGAKALGEATAIADANGIPFISEVVAIGNYLMASANQYVPDSYFSKYKDLDSTKVAQMTNVANFALDKYTPAKDFDCDDDDEEYYESSSEEY